MLILCPVMLKKDVQKSHIIQRNCTNVSVYVLNNPHELSRDEIPYFIHTFRFHTIGPVCFGDFYGKDRWVFKLFPDTHLPPMDKASL